MPALRDLQGAFAAAALGGDASGLLALLEPDGLDPARRLDVHRTNVMLSLTDALAATFPAVCRLVHMRFFAYAAAEFVRRHPPRQPLLALYGGEFPDFLAEFPPCGELAYLADVARLEWRINLVSQAREAPPLPPAALGAFAPDELGRLTFRLQPTRAFLSSPWPVDRIWDANRSDISPGRAIDLDDGTVWLELVRRGAEFAVRRLDGAAFAFRAALHAGETLERASEAAIACDGSFDLCRALPALFADGAVIDAALSSPSAAKEVFP